MTAIFRDNPHGHFNATWDQAKVERRLHERGQENKVRWAMGERNKARLKSEAHHERRIAVIHASHTPVTLATLKWMKP